MRRDSFFYKEAKDGRFDSCQKKELGGNVGGKKLLRCSWSRLCLFEENEDRSAGWVLFCRSCEDDAVPGRILLYD